ncbi:hypothetical protein BDV11DRAFT_213256 [Aspergillus similis]
MASIGRITGALVNGTLEPSLALANLNFDFTLIRVDAPREFADVGSQLSAQRRNNAEAGRSHVLARKLGALFRDVVPPTPELVKAYGNRSSEIFNATVAKSKTGALHGFFAGVVGADATSMWAAATSGKHAIACHLLACLLARMWDAPEATSYWMDLITRRKQEINSDNEELGDPTLAIVSRESFQRNELAEWDASARAWLRVADAAMALQQTQVRLILDNIALPVNGKTDTYESIIDAWKSSLQQMESLLVGHPQEARDGAIVLGLYAWHLYPDMIVLGAEEKDVKQNDPLFEGRGILTVGLTRVQTPECQGVYWSLPLRYLRHYGLPVHCKRSLHSGEGTRINIDQLLLAWTAAYLRPWDDGTLPEESVLAFFIHITDRINKGLEGIMNSPFHDSKKSLKRSWLETLAIQAQRYLKSANAEKKVLSKLWNLGKAHCPIFLRELVENGLGDTKLLRRSSYLIRYSHVYHTETKYEYATAVPQVKRTLFDGDKKNHTRWIWKLPSARENIENEAVQLMEEASLYLVADSFQDPSDFDFWGEQHALIQSGEQESCGHCDRSSTSSETPSQIADQAVEEARKERDVHITLRGEAVESVDMLRIFEDVQCTHVVAPADLAGWYIVVLGDKNCQLLERVEPLLSDGDDGTYEKTNEKNAAWATDPRTGSKAEKAFESRLKFTTDIKQKFFLTGKVSFKLCAELFAKELSLADPALLALRGLSSIAALYEDSQSATVDIRVIKLDLSSARWLVSAGQVDEATTDALSNVGRQLGPIQLDYAASFACIAMMETGRFDLDPKELGSVTALSSGDSLYVPSSLLHDPIDDSHRFRIQRLTGNIGRAGLAFLVPPSDPMIKCYDALNDWQLIDYAKFDGCLENNFASTSLQLSFTEATLPLNVGFSGGVDIEAYFLETLVSVYDSGQWVADLDVLKALESNSVYRVSPCPDIKRDRRLPNYTSVDRFAEMLCEYSGIGIIRASRNWQARLAATAICVAKGYGVVIMDEMACWSCVDIQVERASKGTPVQKVVVIS